jgi:hypothetical protein
MALTVSKVHRWHAGGVTQGIYNITFDSSYPTNGEDFSAVSADFREVLAVEQTVTDGDMNAMVSWTSATNLLVLLLEGDADGIYAEAGNGTNQSAIAVQVKVTGL